MKNPAEVFKNWTDLPCGYAYKWDGEEGRLSDGATDETEAPDVPKDQVLAEIKSDCGLDLDYNEVNWDAAFGEPDCTVRLHLKDSDDA